MGVQDDKHLESQMYDEDNNEPKSSARTERMSSIYYSRKKKQKKLNTKMNITPTENKTKNEKNTAFDLRQ